MARLILNCQEFGLVMRELSRDIVLIGSARSNHIVIYHPTVSAQHAALMRTGESYWLKDLNSKNGTQVNGDFITDAELTDGDTIQLGAVAAVFAGAYRKPSSIYRVREFWRSISTNGAQLVAVAMASAGENLA